MKGGYVIAGLVFLVLAGLVGADYLTSTVSSDGSILIKTAGSDENGSFESRVMTVDQAALSREISGDGRLASDLTVTGEGPIVVFESASGDISEPDPGACLFLTPDRAGKTGKADLMTTGILGHGRNTISRVVDTGLSGETAVNGSGMMSLRSSVFGNTSLSSSGVVAGNMSTRDLVRFGGRG